ncbi:class I SAM-dependent methyltransferase [Cohnella faecalis]|uniref:SAM-dependent methyltransferase n=1 Tax=Cohnella faecalis TaxID=2315694 RepID=A0A398CU09_9BACL|nr:class I SAM-dependent methyltransferase [Cohnella faecalis]RIE04759.1 SAM-dependent methyltransferase [Cohnella faecalis]
MIVTTAERPSAVLLARAEALAKELGADCVPRRNETLRGMERIYGDDGVLVVSEGGLRYVREDDSPLFFHPSMGLVRIKRLRDGGTDVMIDVSGAQPGDRVLDCTAGLCSDAIVFSYAVGAEGSVTALEASKLLHVIVREGLGEHDTGLEDVNAALRSVEPVLGNHEQWLRGMEDRSVDIVYFDPMFQRPVTTSTSLRPLRGHAHHGTISEETVKHAVRVARKAVVLKDHRDSGEFRRLGFTVPRKTTKAVNYGVIRTNE